MTQDFLPHANDILINVYKFWPVQFVRGKGVYLYSADGQKYLDFAAGIATISLGYAHPALTRALKDQVGRLHMGLCYVADPVRLKAAEALLDGTPFDQAFFCNSGAEAVEGALKTARKRAKESKGPESTEVIYLRNSFHGRTMGALSVNGQHIYRDGFEPMLSGMHEAVLNDLESVKKHMSEKTAAVIVEPVMGEGGVRAATPEFLQGLRDLCDDHDAALIFDEVQCGIGRTGTLHAYAQYGIEPDLICWAKGIGSGFPVGAYAGRRAFTKHITHGSHGSTFGGNPMACRAVLTVLQEIRKPGFLENVQKTGAILQDGLRKIATETGALEDVRGTGMMQAARVANGQAKDLVWACLKEGLVVLSCGENSLRIVPPLILKPKQAEEGLKILEKVIRKTL